MTSIKDKPGGRPAKKRIEKQQRVVSTKLTELQYYAIRKRAGEAGLRVSEYVRQAVVSAEVIPRLNRQDADTIRKLAGEANNINQLAHRANAGGFALVAVELVKLKNRITDVHEGLYGETDLTFTDQLPLDEIDVLFFCTAHGDTKKFMESHNIPENLKIIDLSMDYRIKSDDHDFIYGLPELNRRATCTAKHVANPGCFATCIQLGLLPLAKNLMLTDDVMVNAITGSTGAGVKPGATSHFSWRNNNMSVYKAFDHQHVPEIKQSLKQLQNSFDSDIDFIPYRGDFARGIFATLVVKTKVALEEIVRMYEEYYAKDSFVHIVDKNIDLKQVVNTNKCLIHLEKHGDKLLIISCIDNLLKGASGQAVHNMNLMFNLEETVGLRLKPSAF